MTKASENVFPKLIGSEAAAPGTPAAATAILYVKTDGLWYSKDDAGVETLVSGGTGAAAAFIGCTVVRTTDQTAVVTATLTPVSFNGTDEIDTHAFHDPAGANPERIIIPSGKDGKYNFIGWVIFDTNATGSRSLRWRKNGTTQYGEETQAALTGTNFSVAHSQSGAVAMVSTDYMELLAYQTSGGDRTLSGATRTLRATAIYLGT